MSPRCCVAAVLAFGCGTLGTPAAAPPPVVLWVPAESPKSSAQEPEARIEEVSQAARAVVGTWEDSEDADRTWYTIELDGTAPVFRSAVGSAADREVYEVRSSRWDGRSLTFAYFVPSTEYVVTFTTESATATELRARWSNSAGVTGTVVMPRVDARMIAGHPGPPTPEQ
jgi:hypothetical protein